MGRKTENEISVEKRYGTRCKECNCKLGQEKLTGEYNGEKMSFCSFKCMDDYKDKNPLKQP